MHDNGLSRDKADMQLKLLDKYGKQEKDEGLLYLQWTLGSLNNEYVTYLRGKSNVVEVFDAQTDNVFIQKSYKDTLGIIKGLVSMSTDVFNVK